METKTSQKVKENRRLYYWNNSKYRFVKIQQMKEYYHINRDYFYNYVRTEDFREKAAKRRKTEEYLEYQKEWRAKNKSKINKHSRKCAIKNRQKYRLTAINKKRVEKGLEPVKDVEIHFQQRKERWFKVIYYPHLYKEKEDEQS